MVPRRQRDLAGLVLLVTGLVGLVAGEALFVPGDFGPTKSPDGERDEEALPPMGRVVASQDSAVTAPPVPRGEPIDAPTPRAARKVGNTGRKPVADGVRIIPHESFDVLDELDAGLEAKAASLEFEKTADGKHYKLPFRKLSSFTYVHPEPEALAKSETPFALLGNQVPESIRKLSGQKAVVVGFMVPFDLAEDGSVVSFAITQNQSFCCYGVAPAINEWVLVDAAADLKVTYNPVTPIAVFGTFEVGEEIEGGFVLSLYRMKAAKVSDASDLVRESLRRP
jgi:hypothetical protein